MSIPLNTYLSLYKRYLAKEGYFLGLLVLGTICALGCRLAAPLWLRSFVNLIGDRADTQSIYVAVAMYTALQIAQRALNIATSYLSEHIGQRATDALRLDVIKHALTLDMSYHKEHTPGEMINRLDADINGIGDFFARFWSGVLVSILALVGTLSVLVYLAPMLGLLTCVSSFVAIVSLFRVKNLMVPYSQAEFPKRAEFFGTVGELLSAGEDIRGNGATAYVTQKVNALLQAWSPTYVQGYMSHSTMWSVLQIFFSVNSALTFGVCYGMWQQGVADVGTVFMLVSYGEQIRLPLSQLHQRFADLQRADAALIRINETLALRSTLPDEGSHPLDVHPLQLELDNISFAYVEGQDVLRDLSFTLPAGQTLGLLGRTGSGKSTLAHMLVRLYDPYAGRILLGGTPLPSYPLSLLRKRIAFVSQDVQLYRASVRDNLTFFDRGISDQSITAALDTLGLSDWLTDLPRGLDSIINEDVGLSAGEAQLLALSRAFLSQPALVILDEPSARIDPVTELRLNKAIEALMQQCTGIIIAHHLATLRHVDRILILDNGNVLEEGSAQELREDPSSHYSALLRTHLQGVM